MTITTWPIDATPAVPGRQLREAQSVYMAGGSAALPFGVLSGVRPGTSSTTVTATSTTWTVGAHAGVVDLQPAVEASGYAYAVNATGGLPSGAVTAADLTRPRVDIVWVRNDDPSEGDASPNPTVVFGYTAGAPLASPVAPATPARCMVLATIQVPMSGGGSPTVIWTAPYMVAAGAPTPVYSAADRDAKFPAPYDGLAVYRLDTHYVETYNGTGWGVPGGRVVHNATAYTVPASAWSILTAYWMVDQPAVGMAAFDGTMWTITTPGVYDVEAGFHTTTPSINVELIVKLNDTTASPAGTLLAGSAQTGSQGGAASAKGRVRLNAGDTLRYAVYASAAAVWTTSTSNYEWPASFFGLRFVEPLR